MSVAKRDVTVKWSNPQVGVFISLFAVAGLVSSVNLLLGELQLLQDSNAALACDVNPLIACSTALLTPQAHLLVLPNSAVGLGAFSALLLFGLVLLFRGGIPRLVWWGLSAGMLAGLGFVSYFVHQSVTVFHTLCPYCVLTWVAILGILPLALGGALAAGAYGKENRGRGRTLLRYWWAVWLLLLLLIVLVVLVGLSDRLGYLF